MDSEKMQDTDEEELTEKLKYPCTYLSKMKNTYTQFLTKTVNSYDIYKRNKAQKRDMTTLRELMENRKARYLCHLNERKLQAKIQQQKSYRSLMHEFDIDIKNSEVKLRISKKIEERENMRNKQNQDQKARMVKIVRKLLQEQKRQDQIDAQKNKIYYEVKKIPKKKRLFDFEESEEEIGEDILDNECIDEAEQWEELDHEPKIETAKSDMKSDEKQDKNSKKISNKKGSTGSSNSRSSKSSSIRKKSKSKVSSFELPPIPNTNPREKLVSISEVDLEQLEKNFEESDKLLQSHAQFRLPKEKCLEEYGFSWQPKTVVFDKLNGAKLNYQRLTVANNGRETKYCTFEQIKATDDFREGIIEIQPQTSQKLTAGMSFTFYVYFNPEQEFKNLSGEIIFNAYSLDDAIKRQFRIPFNCIPPQSNVNIFPKNIVFSKLFYWELKKHNTPQINLEIQNVGNKACKIIIRKENIEDDFLNVLETFDNISSLKSEKQYSPMDKMNIVDEIMNICLQNIYSTFSFSSYILDLAPKSKKITKILFKNPSFIGLHLEKYSLIALENQGTAWDIVDQQPILVQAEILGKYITLEEETLDFGICLFDSAYQEIFHIKNEESFPVNIGFRLPSRIRESIFIIPPNASLRAKQKMCFCIKFIPRKELQANIYFHPITNILNFPIKIYTASPKNNVPPTILNTFAILTSPKEVYIKPTSNTPFVEQDGKITINLGRASTHETILCDFEIENYSSVEQEFGFLNLPEYITIHPNFGFGILQPGEIKKMTLYCSSNIRDVPIKSIYDEEDCNKICFQIKCNTISALGGLTEKEVKKVQRRKSKNDIFSKYIQEKELVPSLQTDKNTEMWYEASEDASIGIEDTTSIAMESFIEVYEEESFDKMIQTNTLNFIVEVEDNWCEISHQFIRFPDTPMGSFSIVTTNFNAFNQSSINNCVCGYLNDKKITNFKCNFELFGGSDEIIIEPTCGTLKFKESKKITLIVKPKMDEDIVQEKAEIYKIFRIQKEKEEEESKKKKGKKSANKDKKTNTKDKDKKNADLSNVYKNYNTDNKDLYNAEKELWRFVKPNEISTKFTCLVTFPDLKDKEPEYLYIEAKCLVIKPDFILHTNTQILDFGQVLIGAEKKMKIKIENISDKEISPTISFINPAGSFECFLPKIKLEREHILSVPIMMKPSSEQSFHENLDIQYGHTKCSLILKGEGINLEYEMKPSFVVCRLEAKLGGKTDCNFTIINKCRAPMELKIKKLFELEGTFVKVPSEPMQKQSTAPKAKDKVKKEIKVKKLSNDLTEEEYYSLNNDQFMKFDTEPKFTLATDETFTIDPFEKSVIKIKFELPKKLLDPNGREKREGSFVSKYEIWLCEIILLHDFFIIGQLNNK